MRCHGRSRIGGPDARSFLQRHEPRTSLRLLAAAHSGSGSPHPTHFSLGVGSMSRTPFGANMSLLRVVGAKVRGVEFDDVERGVVVGVVVLVERQSRPLAMVPHKAFAIVATAEHSTTTQSHAPVRIENAILGAEIAVRVLEVPFLSSSSSSSRLRCTTRMK